MTATPQFPHSLRAGALWIAPGTILPPEWRLATAVEGRGGWLELSNRFDTMAIDRQLAPIGWTFFFIASILKGAAYGWNQPRMIESALTRLFAAVRKQKCNCLEIDGVGMHRFLGFPYLQISAHPRNIQKGNNFNGA